MNLSLALALAIIPGIAQGRGLRAKTLGTPDDSPPRILLSDNPTSTADGLTTTTTTTTTSSTTTTTTTSSSTTTTPPPTTTPTTTTSSTTITPPTTTVATTPPTPFELATGKTATQSTTYKGDEALYGALNAVDGDDFTSTITKNEAESLFEEQWWEVDLASVYTIVSVFITNRQTCTEKCINWLHDFDIVFLDGGKNVVHSISQDVTFFDKLFDVDVANVQYVKIQFQGIGRSDDHRLQLAEVSVLGY